MELRSNLSPPERLYKPLMYRALSINKLAKPRGDETTMGTVCTT